MSIQADAAAATPPAGRRAMAIRGFFCQNVAIGCAFGGFGLTVLPVQAQFGVSRGIATLGLPLTVLAMGLTIPVVAGLIGRIGLRLTMLIGIVLSATGYAMLAVAPNIYVMLFAYAVPIGIGIAMFGTFASSVLAGNWFQPNPGLAIGFVNTPLAIALLPMAALAIIAWQGLTVYFICLAALHILLLPLAWGIRGAPEGVPAAEAGHEGGAQAAFVVPATVLLRQPAFWIMVVGAGALNSIGITGVSHIVAFAIERGIAPGRAAMLLSVLGSASIVGALLAGLVCGRLGGARTLTLLAMGLGLSWLVLLATRNFVFMVPAAFVIGISGAGVTPALSVLSGQLHGPPSLARVLGLAMMASLPFTFCLPPLVGVLHDAAGGYAPVAMAITALCAAVALMFYATARVERRRARLQAGVPLSA